LVQGIGLPAALFVIYLLSKTLLFWGMIRIVQCLLPGRSAGVLALIYAMAVGINYGGHQLLNVQENFLTPRTPACAFALIGLDLLLRGRPIWSLAILLFAAGIHPLMAFGPLLLWTGYVIWTYLGLRTFVAALAGAALVSAVVLVYEPIGHRLFGTMDDEWRESILHASSFNFPSQWAWRDWAYLGFQLALLSAAIYKLHASRAPAARFLIVLAIVTCAGAVGAVLAEQLPYALLLQGQPYRALWLLALLHLAIACWLLFDWSAHSCWLGRLAGCGLLAYLCSVNAIPEEYALPILLFPLVAVIVRGLGRQPADPDWLVRSVRMSLVLGALGWAGYKAWLLGQGIDELWQIHWEYRDIAEVFARNLGPIVLCLLACGLLVTLRQRLSSLATTAWSAAAFVGIQTLFFAVPETDFYLEHGTRYRADLREAHAHIHASRSDADPLPTVYCNLGCLDYVWVDLHAKSYFDWWQAGNFMFRRDMAIEGRRRARIVAPFEVARFRKLEKHLSAGGRQSVERFFQTDFERGPVSAAELARLCREPDLDFLVLDHEVAGVRAMPVGRLYLYSCRDVRSALGLPSPQLDVRTARRDR
jgi:hypothetical protein